MNPQILLSLLGFAALGWATDLTSISGTWVQDTTKTKASPALIELKLSVDEFWQKMSFAPKGTTIKLDGSGTGPATSMRRIDERTLEQTFYRKGKAYGTSRYTLSPDGQQYTILAEGTYPNGKPYSNTIVYRRKSGAASDGFTGTWQADQTASTHKYPFEMTFATEGDALKFEDGGGFTVYTAPLDCKEHPTSGDMANQTVALERLPDNSIQATFKTNGKVTRTVAYVISADGKTLTETTDLSLGGENRRTVSVYDRK